MRILDRILESCPDRVATVIWGAATRFGRVRQQLWLTGACTLDQQRRLWASDSIGDFRIDGTLFGLKVTLFGFAFRSVELHLKKIGACGGPRFFLRLQRDPFGERKGRNRVSDSRYF